MTTEHGQLEPGMDVFTSDGQAIGTIERIFWPDGRVVPPEEHHQEGTFDLSMRPAPGGGYFRVNVTLAPDWYVPFTAIEGAFRNRVTLNLTYDEASKRSWQVKPD
ncbi:MAG: hypothetical protein ACRDFS_13275 [Chloroflexota bacterium]